MRYLCQPIVNAKDGKGGVWAGGVDYVRSTGDASEGLEALREKGAKPWPNQGIEAVPDVEDRPGPAASAAQGDMLEDLYGSVADRRST